MKATPPSYSPQGYPSQDNPPLGYPSQGYSPQGYPPQGYPPQSYPPQPPVGMQQQQQSTNTTVIIQNQPQAQVVTAVVPIVHDYLGLSIFACFCCFCPLGVVAIFKSIESRDRYTAGDYAGATNSARTALTLAKISIALGIILYIISIVVRSV
ncbi:cysteine-rich and transmembrane domain-containing protein 1-like [Xenia sp. Carnegie-2017]|uniref:cysteine-rich and transmembrane domain-containing protein 1-like n=1 Tax=Xenia sp. Carnegie-2017 TaxID=2897299 RepID=UPI001F03D32C|nr:cysteine-rich and transmembrane domain-containing protein 1-like [Xenia sp. Carnegie-2017]